MLSFLLGDPVYFIPIQELLDLCNSYVAKYKVIEGEVP
jgi:hypothetical protein